MTYQDWLTAVIELAADENTQINEADAVELYKLNYTVREAVDNLKYL